jgi:hypothetical protein
MFRLLCLFGSILVISPGLLSPLLAQVFEVGGGTSTLYQESGGSITTHAASYDFTMGAGSIGGELIEGARLTRATPHAKYIFGDNQISFELPTDIFNTSHLLLVRGAGIQTTRGATKILAFAGAAATGYSSPFFIGAKTSDFSGVIFLQTRLSSHVQLFSDSVASKKTTSIEAIEWSPRPKFDIALSVGEGANQPYAASSFKFSRHWIDADAAYIEAGQQFQRIALITPLQSEPDRENLLVTVRPFKFMSFTGAHQNYLDPQISGITSIRSSVDQGSAGLRLFATQLNGTIFHSTYQGQTNDAGSFSAMRDITQRFHIMANYLTSRPKDLQHTNSFISTLSETVSPRLTLNENVTTSGGNTGITFGGQIFSNFITVNANYDTFFVPANNNSFKQALVFDVRINLFGRLMLHGGSFVDPNGHIRNTFDASTIMWHGQSSHPVVERIVMEPAIMRGCVVDPNRNPVEGAALLIDKRMVYTGSDGCFFLRDHRPRTHRLQVVVPDFLGSGNWQIVSVPSTITSRLDTDKAGPPVVVVVAPVKSVTRP